MTPTGRRITLTAAALAVAGGIAAVLVLMRDGGAGAAHAAPGLDAPVTAAEVSADGFRVVPEVLRVVYEAFGETGEAEIYDRLAEVAAADALEALYLERIGAMAEDGLEPDQQIHEMELIALSSRPGRDAVEMAARWRVLGTVGHAEHLHVRGNAYAADLTLEPVDGAWRLTGFALTDVDRTGAGTLTDRVEGPWTGGAQTGAEIVN
jgi:hypothetical protein